MLDLRVVARMRPCHRTFAVKNITISGPSTKSLKLWLRPQEMLYIVREYKQGLNHKLKLLIELVH